MVNNPLRLLIILINTVTVPNYFQAFYLLCGASVIVDSHYWAINVFGGVVQGGDGQAFAASL
jgi:hypothetical protein